MGDRMDKSLAQLTPLEKKIEGTRDREGNSRRIQETQRPSSISWLDNNSKREYLFSDDATKLKSTSIENPNENSNKPSLNCVSLHIETIFIQLEFIDIHAFLCTDALSY